MMSPRPMLTLSAVSTTTWPLALSGSQYFSTLDLTSGYWQNHRRDLLFQMGGGWRWKWKVLPFGLASTPATFQRLIEKVPHRLPWKTLLVYLESYMILWRSRSCFRVQGEHVM